MTSISVLVLLSLLVAFDTVDHSALQNRLAHCVGLSECALNWFKTYIHDRDYFVLCARCLSERLPITCGVPQGTILRPLLFNLNTPQLANIIQDVMISYHMYADETLGHQTTIGSWMLQNLLQLNEDKSKLFSLLLEERLRLSPDFNSLSLKNLKSSLTPWCYPQFKP